ncbi:NAD(P)-dependent alcohol dehydrogenase [Francisella sp. 19X1-34]|uniref:NAD(P)-dependent alcohol dehydrogenase n=1 Tax=Francisella sp. 19X1-34 TaxID=3087177 RepID=UPI002E36B0C8|nr:NAD(P)-dependent alcohol dehydrogenase [Francisella sp. 19X1-34]MED7788390.1 NAD(P)-dependent alcohol dehydrogenase [Francisella sp. 19X1-34]
MKALYLDKINQLSIKDIKEPAITKDDEVKIKIKSVGICGSDLHYFTEGRIGDFIVKEPMILGHESSGEVVEIGKNVTNLKVGDRVCMEPGIPSAFSEEVKQGYYNLDPAVRFWATPPYDGCCCDYVVHPETFTFKIPDNVSYNEAAMVEPLSVGMQAATKANIKPGDLALVYGAGTIGAMTALSAIAGGCSEVIIVDVSKAKLEMLEQYDGIITLNSNEQDVLEFINEKTNSRGVDIVFECCGVKSVIDNICKPAKPGGKVIFVGMPNDTVNLDIVAMQVKELKFESVFRYCNMFPRSINLIASGKINLKPLITKKFSFKDAIHACEYAKNEGATNMKVMIEF